jgi:hypothetical protein
MFWVQAGQMGSVIQRVTEWFEELLAWFLAEIVSKVIGGQ